MKFILTIFTLMFVTNNAAGADDMTPKKLQLNTRGLMCEKFQFEELNAMNPEELEQLLCSYRFAEKSSALVHERMMARESNPKMSIYLLDTRLKEMTKCTDPQYQIGDLLKRKFPTATQDCSKYIEAK